MSNQENAPDTPTTVACEICLKEIPKDLGTSEESVEYVYYFCGQDCFEKWQEKSKKES